MEVVGTEQPKSKPPEKQWIVLVQLHYKFSHASVLKPKPDYLKSGSILAIEPHWTDQFMPLRLLDRQNCMWSSTNWFA